MRPHVLGLFAVLALAQAGCASVRVGAFDVRKEDWELQLVKVRASFDLKCEAALLDVKVLAVQPTLLGGNFASQVGISGCGGQAVYWRDQYWRNAWIKEPSSEPHAAL